MVACRLCPILKKKNGVDLKIIMYSKSLKVEERAVIIDVFLKPALHIRLLVFSLTVFSVR